MKNLEVNFICRRVARFERKPVEQTFKFIGLVLVVTLAAFGLAFCTRYQPQPANKQTERRK